MLHQQDLKAQRKEDCIQRQHKIKMDQVFQENMQSMMMTMIMIMNPMMISHQHIDNNINPTIISINPMIISTPEVNMNNINTKIMATPTFHNNINPTMMPTLKDMNNIYPPTGMNNQDLHNKEEKNDRDDNADILN